MTLFAWAAGSTAVSALVLWYWLRTLRGTVSRTMIALAAVALPLSALVNIGLKQPILRSLVHALGLEPSPQTWTLGFVLIALVLAPLTEEPVKLLPLCLRGLRTRMGSSPAAAFATGMLLGAAFGIGETWYLAAALSHRASASWWAGAGFFTERSAVTFAHGCLTSMITIGMYRLRGGRALALAMGLHYLLNLAAGLHRSGIIGTPATAITTAGALMFLFHLSLRTEAGVRMGSVSLPAPPG